MQVVDGLMALQDVIIDMADEHVETYMPGYTHLQHAQPTTFGHYLMRHYFTFERDQQRIESAFGRVDLSALGGAAMTGTSWPIDRTRVAELLGHDGLIENAYDTGVFAQDYPAENAAVLSLMLSNIGRLAADLYVWSSWEFGMVEIDDALAGSSSIMPQKKNPNALERVRGLCGSSLAWFPAVVGTLRSASSSDLDLHFGGDRTNEMRETTVAVLELMRSVLTTLSVKTDIMHERAGASWSTATNLADEVVRRTGISFRSAHRVVGRMVRNALEEGIGYRDITAFHLDSAAEQTLGQSLGLSDEVVAHYLEPVGAVGALVTPGSAHPDAVRVTLEQARARQARHRRWWEDQTERVASARQALRAAVDGLAGALESS